MKETINANSFETHTESTVEEVRGALSAVLHNLGVTSKGVTELHRTTNLDMKLCWKISRMLEAPTPLAAAAYIPGPSNFKTILRHASRNGVDDGLRNQMSNAVERFDQLVRVHATDRRAFDSMVSDYSVTSKETLDRDHRRNAFRANRHIWGVEADAHLSSFVLAKSQDDESKLDAAFVVCVDGLRRLRRSRAPLFIQCAGGVNDTDGSAVRIGETEPIDPTGPSDQHLSLMREFCSENVSDLETSIAENGYIEATLPDARVGLSEAMTLSMGQVYRSVFTRYATKENDYSGQSVYVQVPTPSLIIDLILDESVFGMATPRAKVYVDRSGRTLHPEFDDDNLIMDNLAVSRFNGGVIGAGDTPVPRYQEMLERTFNRLGVPADRFLIYRLSIEYPVMMSRGVIQCPMPDPPASS